MNILSIYIGYITDLIVGDPYSFPHPVRFIGNLIRYIEKKIRRYGKCNTIIIGKFAGKENAFLIQNAFPIIDKYFDHVHTIENKPVAIHKKLDRELIINLREVLAMYKRGIHLIFPDIERIQELMEKELSR